MINIFARDDVSYLVHRSIPNDRWLSIRRNRHSPNGWRLRFEVSIWSTKIFQTNLKRGSSGNVRAVRLVLIIHGHGGVSPIAASRIGDDYRTPSQMNDGSRRFNLLDGRFQLPNDARTNHKIETRANNHDKRRERDEADVRSWLRFFAPAPTMLPAALPVTRMAVLGSAAVGFAFIRRVVLAGRF
jgi:hypothetical protein